MTPLEDASHTRDLIAYRAMGLLQSMLELGVMPVQLLATANELNDQFRAATEAIAAARRPVVNPGSPHCQR